MPGWWLSRGREKTMEYDSYTQMCMTNVTAIVYNPPRCAKPRERCVA